MLHGGGDCCAIGTLAHHAEQGLGPREAHKDAPTCLCERRLSLANRVLEIRFREQSLPLTWGYRHRSLELRVKGNRIGHLPNGDPRASDQPEHSDRAEEAVASWRELREEEVATLLTTEANLTSGESFGNVSVADGGTLQSDPVGGKVTLHAAIG